MYILSQRDKLKQAESIEKQIQKEIEAVNEVKDLNLKEKKETISQALCFLLEMNAVNKMQWKNEVDKEEFEEDNVTTSSTENNAKEGMSNEDKLKVAKRRTRKFEKVVKSLGEEQGNTRDLLEKGKQIGTQIYRLMDELDDLPNIGGNLIEKKKNIERALLLVSGINIKQCKHRYLGEEIRCRSEHTRTRREGEPNGQRGPSKAGKIKRNL